MAVDKYCTVFLIYIALVVSMAEADYGACRYDIDMCSCRLGNDNQGTCWDRLADNPGLCASRSCRPGWTCTCGNRTHLCHRQEHTAMRVSLEDSKKATAPCTTTKIYAGSTRELALGSFKLFISETGLAANACNELAWWLNGELMGNHKPVLGMTTSMVQRELEKRRDHSLLELRPGDLLAFRFRAGSYYCFKHYAKFVVNGTSLDLLSPGVSIQYSRQFTEKWFDPLYEPEFGTGEDDPDLTKWIPLRRTMLAEPVTIEPAVDYFEPLAPDSPDHKSSNWYFRVELPHIIAH